MDIDIGKDTKTQEATSSSDKKVQVIVLPVDEAHPFDLESYISNYSGRTAIDRLLTIIVSCPSIAPEAFQLAVKHIHKSRDPSLYQHLLQAYEQAASIPDVSLPNIMDLAEIDTKWVDDVTTENHTDRVKLEVELKTYTNNMLKECICMAHRDLGHFYRATGDYGTSLKHYTKSRGFCTTSQHVLEICVSILELLIEQRNYAHLTTYVSRADAALDASAAAASPAPASASTGFVPASSTATKKQSADRESVRAKLYLATALANLGQGVYEKAANAFLKIGPPKDLNDWLGKLVAPGDIAIYGTLCALSTFPRSYIRSKILENSYFGWYIEEEPYVRELIEAYMRSNFKTVLELLNKYSTRHFVDIHLSSHVNDLVNSIRNSAVLLYFQPFASIKLECMSAAFGWIVEEVEYHVVNLIQAGYIQGRVDSQNKIMKAKNADYRDELFARAIKATAETQVTNRKLLLQMRLQQADLIVKPPPKSFQQPDGVPEFYAGPSGGI